MPAPAALSWQSRNLWVRPICLFAGLLLPQIAEYGPSLVGAKILLPLELLGAEGIYLPDIPAYQGLPGGNHVNLDKVEQYEPARQFAARELRAGRFPTWFPYGHCGTPFPMSFSPFVWMYLAVPDPIILAWIQLIKAVLAGLGAFLFFRRALDIDFWPAAMSAWAFPLCGYMVFWQGHFLSDAATWLPWVLLATDAVVRRPLGWGGPGLALGIAAIAVTGVVDVLALALWSTALYAIYRQAALKGWSLRAARLPAGVVVVGWIVGILLAACTLLPLADFAKTGSRIQGRAQGAEERPPVGRTALLQVVLPYCYGDHHDRRLHSHVGALVLPESSATAYAGLLAALCAAPLAFADPRQRKPALFWLGMVLLGLGWQLKIPILVSIWRLPGFNLCSHNRDTLVAAFSILCLSALGLQACARGVRWQRWMGLPIALLIGLAWWSTSRSINLPDPIGKEMANIQKNPEKVPQERAVMWTKSAHRFSDLSLWGTGLCALAMAWWLAQKLSFGLGYRSAGILGIAIVVELTATSWGYNSQADPKLYYPPIPILERLRQDPSARILGVGCLPANLAATVPLADIRGYDAVDPRRYVELLMTAGDPNAQSASYARTQSFVPVIGTDSKRRLKLPAAINLLGVRYLIFRNRIRPEFIMDEEADYFVGENQDALPRAFVPRQVKAAPSSKELLRRFSESQFDPRAVAFVEDWKGNLESCNGKAAITIDVPGEVVIQVETDAPGIVVLADSWFEGWEATVNGQAAPVMIADHALRGVSVPAGNCEVRMIYRPAALRRGLLLSSIMVCLLTVWAGAVVLGQRSLRSKTNQEQNRTLKMGGKG